MTTSVLGSTLASLSLWTMSLIDSMVPFLLEEGVLVELLLVVSLWLLRRKSGVHLEVTADEELTRHDCGVVWELFGKVFGYRKVIGV